MPIAIPLIYHSHTDRDSFFGWIHDFSDKYPHPILLGGNWLPFVYIFLFSQKYWVAVIIPNDGPYSSEGWLKHQAVSFYPSVASVPYYFYWSNHVQ